MKISRSLRIIAFVTCALFTVTTLGNAAPNQGSYENIQLSKSMLPAQACGPAIDLAPQPLSEVIAWIQKLIDSSADPQSTAEYAHSFFKRAYGSNKRIDALVTLLHDEEKMQSLGLKRSDVKDLLSETQRSIIRLRGAQLTQEKKGVPSGWERPANRTLDELLNVSKNSKVSEILGYKEKQGFTGSRDVRLEVIAQLATIGSYEAYDAMSLFFNDPDWYIRSKALGYLASLDANAKNIEPKIIK